MFIETTIISELKKTCGQSKVIPVVTIDDADKAVPISEALVAGGIRIIEVTLRTPNALDAIRNIKQSECTITIGAGTILNSNQAYEAKKAGADFGVSPGTTLGLLDAAYDCTLPMLPGISTVSEIMLWKSYGVDFFKFFPAEASGGHAFLHSLTPLFTDISFCPTGGITQDTANKYLRLPNVLCVGGSWLCPDESVSKNNFNHITQLASKAVQI